MAKSTADRLIELATAATLERIRRDAAGASEPVRSVLLDLAERFFEIGFDAARWRRGAGFTRKTGRRFRAELGVGPKRYLLRCKREMAQWLLLRTNVRIWRIGTLLGYSQPRNFSRDFAVWTGVSPGEYRRTRRAPDRPLVLADPTPALGARIALGEATPEEKRQLAEEIEARFPATANPARFEQLSRSSREAGRRDRQRGVELAGLALAALEGDAGELGDGLVELRALGHARLGNALRLAEDFPAADEAFVKAWELWRTPRREQDCRIHAEICFLEGSLRLFQRRLDTALDLLNRAIALARVAGESGLVVRALLQRVSLFGYRGDFEATVPDLRLAQLVLGSLVDSELDLHVSQALATACTLVGDYDLAREALCKARALAENIEHPLVESQLRLIEGLIDLGEGDTASAERLLDSARSRFIDLGELGYAAAAALELAGLHLQRGTTTEALRMASEALPVFDNLGIHQQALAAADLLRQAIMKNRLTAAVLRKVRKLLWRIEPLSRGRLDTSG